MKLAVLCLALAACGGDDAARAQLAPSLLGELPAARGNAHTEDINAQVLGFHVFFDARFSETQAVRCESCHSVERSFADGQPISTAGLGPGVRNAPSLFNAARYATFFWDGRADTLWSQPLFAFENPAEMDCSRLELVHLLDTLHGAEYEKAFGPLPEVSDLSRFPARGKPGDAAFDAMAPADQDVVNLVVANLGKAIEAYVRKLATGPSVIDRALGGELAALTAPQRRGMSVFVDAGCLSCHSGPQLSDGKFHNLGIAALDGQAPDAGRQAAIAILDGNPFNAAGRFFDGVAPVIDQDAPVLGGFRTPSLRNLVGAAPYGHNGGFATLDEIVDFHLAGGGKDRARFVGEVDPLLVPKSLSDGDRTALIEFLKALGGQYPALPWGQWPNGNG